MRPILGQSGNVGGPPGRFQFRTMRVLVLNGHRAPFPLAGRRAPRFIGLLSLTTVAGLGGGDPGRLAAQSVRVTVPQEAFRQTPNGKRLGTVMRDAEFPVLGRRGAWTQVRLEGWVWTPSLVRTQRDGFDLAVSAAAGENLRERPGGRILARLLQGFLLEKVEDGQGWTHVRRAGWVWGPSLAAVAAAERAPARQVNRPPPAGERPAAPTASAEERERVVVGPSGVGLRVSPRGDTAAVLRGGADLEVLDRRPGWARVRLEGWVPTDDLSPAGQDSTLAELSAADLRANPSQYRGRRVRWSVQFISLEKAEAARTDFYEGEPFLLARAPDPQEGFVYLAVPPRLLSAVERLRGLETIEVLASVRTGRSSLMGVPILDLLTLY
ncbi:MAG: hypothetical protein ACE5HP_10500 [Gemmatimonadota bacterium]